MMNWDTGKNVGIQIPLNLGLTTDFLSLPLRPALPSKPRMYHRAIAIHQLT